MAIFRIYVPVDFWGVPAGNLDLIPPPSVGVSLKKIFPRWPCHPHVQRQLFVVVCLSQKITWPIEKKDFACWKWTKSDGLKCWTEARSNLYGARKVSKCRTPKKFHREMDVFFWWLIWKTDLNLQLLKFTRFLYGVQGYKMILEIQHSWKLASPNRKVVFQQAFIIGELNSGV